MGSYLDNNFVNETPPDGWKYALRRYDLHPYINKIVSGYTETVTSICFSVNGVFAPTVFLKDRNTVLRNIKFGWKDETAQVKQELRDRRKKKTEERQENHDKIEHDSTVKRKPRKK